MRKLAALAMAAFMAASLAACTGAGNSAQSTAAQDAATTEAQSAAAATDAQSTTAAQSATDAAQGTTAEQTAAAAPEEATALLPHTGETVTLRAVAMDTGVTESKDSPVYKVYKEAVGNIDVEWELIPGSDLDPKVGIYLNSGDIPDILWYKAGIISSEYMESGLFLDFSQHAGIMPNWQLVREDVPGLANYDSVSGKQLMVFGRDNDYPAQAFIANKTYLDSFGIAVPETLAEMEDAMQKIIDADPAATPFLTSPRLQDLQNYTEPFENCLRSYRKVSTAGMYFDLNDKLWKHCALSPESRYKELITLMSEYFAKGFFNPEFATMSFDQHKALIKTGKWAFTYTYGGNLNAWYDIPTEEPLPIEIQVMLPPSVPGFKPTTADTYSSDRPGWAYTAGANTKYPELVSAWIDAQLSPAVATAFQWGVEGESYEVVNGEKQWKPEFLAKGAQGIKDFGIWNILGPRYITWRDDVSNIRRGPADQAVVINTLVDAIYSGAIDCEYPRTPPALDADEMDEYSQIINAAKTMMDENDTLFVLGRRSLSEWDAYLQELLSVADLNRAVELYNNAPQNPDRVPSGERKYIRP
jgi:putative aldouronate transport system substrate-binding protein